MLLAHGIYIQNAEQSSCTFVLFSAFPILAGICLFGQDWPAICQFICQSWPSVVQHYLCSELLITFSNFAELSTVHLYELVSQFLFSNCTQFCFWKVSHSFEFIFSLEFVLHSKCA